MSRSNDIGSLVRPNIIALKPYMSAREEHTGDDLILLDANENPFARELDLNRYPDPLQVKLKKLIAEKSGCKINPENIFLGNGSDQIIDLIIRVFCNPGKDNIIITPPTFGMFRVAADANDITVQSIELLKDFQPNSEKIKQSFSNASKILFLCSPNNPTGNSFAMETIEDLIVSFPGIVVLDEAYIEFSKQGSFLSKLEQFPNLIILQTFSKAWGLAGIRLGKAFANAEIIHYLNALKMPYNINRLTLEHAEKTLRSKTKEEEVRIILEERDQLAQALGALNCIQKVYESDTNFILIQAKGANSLYQYIQNKGLLVRRVADSNVCKECLRITIGTKEQNQLLLDAIKDYS